MKLMLFGKTTSYVDQKELDRLVVVCEKTIGPVERISSTSRDGVGRMEVYGIVTTPAWIAAQDDGTVLGLWQHRAPTLDELASVFRI